MCVEIKTVKHVSLKLSSIQKFLIFLYQSSIHQYAREFLAKRTYSNLHAYVPVKVNIKQTIRGDIQINSW